MGHYIETPEPKRKATQLRTEFPQIRVLPKAEFTTNVSCATVCVVDNGPFEAAAIAYDQNEFNAFNDARDTRPKVWLTVPRTVIETLVGQGRCPAAVLGYLP